jgi:hypothetical protein
VGGKFYPVFAAASALEESTFIVGLVAALGIGGLFGSWLSAERERRERMRERMINAADDFLGAANRATQLLMEADDARERGGFSSITLAPARAAIHEAQSIISRLSVVFPHHEEPHVNVPAHDVTEILARTASVIDRAAAGGRERPDFGELGRRPGPFVLYVSPIAWRRHLQPAIWMRLAARLRTVELASRRTSLLFHALLLLVLVVATLLALWM